MASRSHYQHGSLVSTKRAAGHTDWVLRYRVTLPDGRRAQRQAVVGTTEQYRTESQAQKAADRIRIGINNQQPSAQVPLVRDLVWHFTDRELREDNKRRSWSTQTNYKHMLNHYILPRWETTPKFNDASRGLCSRSTTRSCPSLGDGDQSGSPEKNNHLHSLDCPCVLIAYCDSCMFVVFENNVGLLHSFALTTRLVPARGKASVVPGPVGLDEQY